MTELEEDLIDALREANTNLNLILADVAILMRSRLRLFEELQAARKAFAKASLSLDRALTERDRAAAELKVVYNALAPAAVPTEKAS